MFRKLISLVLACALPTSLALAQAPSGSRLDEIMKTGKLRVCTPGDYKPFSFLRPDGALRREGTRR
jgi:cyclohexadienyl dehydratase